MLRLQSFTAATLLFLLLAPHASAADVPPSAAYRWLDISLEATAREVDRHGARPTIVSRTLAVALTAMYDAWAAYDPIAVGTRLGGTLRRPFEERTLRNKEIAIAYATHRALADVYPDDVPWIDGQMREMGYDPSDRTLDPSKPQGVGNLAADAVIRYRHHDGANQLGDEVGSDGVPYSDYTFYEPKNTTKLTEPNRWQPIPFQNAKGGDPVTPGFLTPHWYRVKPFALDRSDQFRPPAPPHVDSAELKKEVDEVLQYNANLTPQQKALVEFMRDGPRSTGQSGHWLKFAQAVSRRDHDDLDRDVKLFFTVGNVAMDAFIACWESKRYYDTSRPWSLVRYYYAGQKVAGWMGPGKGVAMMPAEEWHPYSPFTFVTPPFPGYVSGHSTVSAASAKILELFTGSDKFGEIEKRKAGVITEADYDCLAMQSREGKAPADASIKCEVELVMPTFSETAQMAGLSRIMGGYHVQADNVEGLALGKKVAEFSWPRIQAYFSGTAKPVE
ncbi:MAG TPA: vanadium-dependent haloperoxidase [Thermoanaerobaculia bacterium]|nr:vanadium-dependent haloperoxidase [Thermoanaerobaculia bacterium]